jgi:RimJ/RimL family protein N-acetyltransferase
MVTQKEMRDFIVARTGIAPTEHFVCIGREKDGELVAVVGYDNYTGTSIEMHVASKGDYWGTKSLLCAAFDYPFNVCNCKVVIGVISSGNEMALRLSRRLGFKTQTVIEDAHPDGALHIMVMRRKDCRWLPKKGEVNGW